MGLFKRVSDIISANLNDLIERFEDPEKMLNQVISEMETAIGKELYERAAELRDAIKLLKAQKLT